MLMHCELGGVPNPDEAHVPFSRTLRIVTLAVLSEQSEQNGRQTAE